MFEWLNKILFPDNDKLYISPKYDTQTVPKVENKAVVYGLVAGASITDAGNMKVGLIWRGWHNKIDKPAYQTIECCVFMPDESNPVFVDDSKRFSVSFDYELDLVYTGVIILNKASPYRNYISKPLYVRLTFFGKGGDKIHESVVPAVLTTDFIDPSDRRVIETEQRKAIEKARKSLLIALEALNKVGDITYTKDLDNSPMNDFVIHADAQSMYNPNDPNL